MQKIGRKYLLTGDPTAKYSSLRKKGISPKNIMLERPDAIFISPTLSEEERYFLKQSGYRYLQYFRITEDILPEDLNEKLYRFDEKIPIITNIPESYDLRGQYEVFRDESGERERETIELDSIRKNLETKEEKKQSVLLHKKEEQTQKELLEQFYPAVSGLIHSYIKEPREIFEGSWNISSEDDKHPAKPEGLAIHPLSHTYELFLSDSNNMKIKVFDSKGKLLRQWILDKQYGLPKVITVSEERVYVSSEPEIIKRGKRKNYVQVFSLEGKFEYLWDVPEGISSISAFGDSIYLALPYSNKVSKYSLEGKLLLDFKEESPYASSIVVKQLDSGEERIYIANGEYISIFDSEGNSIKRWTFLDRNNELSLPYKMAFSSSNELYILSDPGVGKFMQVYDLEGNFLRRWYLGKEITDYSDMVISPDDKIYLSNEGTNNKSSKLFVYKIV